MRKKNRRCSVATGDSPAIGILSFEAATAMFRAVHLIHSLSDAEIDRLRSHTLASPGVRVLVSSHTPHLLALALAEHLDDLNRIAAVAVRLGRRCSAAHFHAFDHVYADLLSARLDSPARSRFLAKDLPSLSRKMERLAAATAALHAKLEALGSLEQSVRKLPAGSPARKVLDQRLVWQKHDIKLLSDSSLWNHSYDEVTTLLARAVFTIHARIQSVFQECEDAFLDDEGFGLAESGIMPKTSGQDCLKNDICYAPKLDVQCGSNPWRFFSECLNLGNLVSGKDSLRQLGRGSLVAEGSLHMPPTMNGKNNFGSWFGPKRKVTSLALPSTIGGSGLALHYANIIIIIEKFLKYPHLIGQEARDDLYQMLPSTLRMALKKSLKSYVKNIVIYDASLVHGWKEVLDKILSWIAPMADSMILWQSSHNFEQQHMVLMENVLLLQTLYFADREKAEAAICELLVGLNHVCRYDQQQNALFDCTSCFDCDDCVDWQMK